MGSHHIVLVGDPQQLPPTVKNQAGKNLGYDRSLFQRLEEGGHKSYMLDVQYRMHPLISEFPRRAFYENALTDGPNVSCRPFGESLKKLGLRPLTILDIEGMERPVNKSMANESEAEGCMNVVKILLGLMKNCESKIGVITPYSGQVSMIRRMFESPVVPGALIITLDDSVEV